MDRFKAKILTTTDKKSERNFRTILANSGEVMESGEVRDLERLYVMGRDGKLVLVGDLERNPDKQRKEYKVNFAANHGHIDPATGERVVDIEDIIGDAKVWLNQDGELMARVYFASDDPKADHAYAISEHASYSIGTEWYPDGYYGADNQIDGTVGILREISMVETGNDPRAQTIDQKPTTAEAQGSAGAADGNNNIKKGNSMKKKLDELTAEEATDLKEQLAATVDAFAAAEPTGEEPAAEAKDEEGDQGEEKTEAEGAKTEAKDSRNVMRSPVVVIRDRAVKQERTADSVKQYLKSDAALSAFGQALIDANGKHGEVAKRFAKVAKARDDVNFGENVTLIPEAVINAVSEQMSDEGTIFNLCFKTGLNYEVVAVPTEEKPAVAHARGKTKQLEEITGETRVLTPEDVYKLMKLNHSMVKINGGIGSSAIVKYVLREMPRKLIEGIDQGILVGGLKDEALQEFKNLISVKSDVAAKKTFGAEYEIAKDAALTRGDISKAAARITSGANRTLVMTQDRFTDLENATTGTAGVPVFPNGIDKTSPNINGITRIITPLWLTDEMMDGYVALLVDFDSYHLVGDTAPETMTDYSIDTNRYVWEVLAMVGGGLASAHAAVGIKNASEAA